MGSLCLFIWEGVFHITTFGKESGLEENVQAGGSGNMTRVIFSLLSFFLVFLFRIYPLHCTVRPPASPLIFCIVDEHTGEDVYWFYFLLGHEVLLFWVSRMDGGHTTGYVGLARAVVVGQ
ncbi:hypothetical protein QBC39DRAFT_163335 [Podospora conica]|nr:hypothetical protein QBC39DRAFT_163335 [Schizothecium conicum]